ncbi:hypothetical protein [Hyphomonas sp.]|uniref:hypothetical protein n=1 Tax=Alphaproteobacteria TaxID=28211 RepID=UPI0032673937
MATKPKARSSPKKAEKPEAAEKEKSQRERFIEAAREIGVDESGETFERAFGLIVPPKAGRKKR